jgi:hypothetical protein
METLDRKRARLRGELQQAYRDWMLASELGDGAAGAPSAIGTSGCAQESKARWFEYLAAKERLVAAYAEQAPAAG